MERALELRLLGPLEVWAQGERRSLPRSKKTRALLAYLAMTTRSHGRARLCELFWDVTDDPRGALRWSLSRLRKVVDDDVKRIDANRESVAFKADAAVVDARDLQAAVRSDLTQLSVEELERLAGLARGEFLEGLELSDFYEFQAWCVAQREQCREARCAVLAELVRRLGDEPKRALPYARAHVQADSLGVAPRAQLLQLLARCGRWDEARKHLDMSCRMYREVGTPGERELRDAWREISAAVSVRPTPATPPRASTPANVLAEDDAASPGQERYVGRKHERQRLRGLVDAVRARGAQRVVLISGEPGAGKSRLADTMMDAARDAGYAVLRSRAFEVESSRPYGIWVDALGSGFTALADDHDGQTFSDRDALFAAVADEVAQRARDAGGGLIVLDDIQWMGRDSAELLHFVARSNRDAPVCIALVARKGELADNEPALKVLRSLRRETKVDEVELAALSLEEVAELVRDFPGADPGDIHGASAGNPLFALELARAAGDAASPRGSVVELVRERIDRLPDGAADVLRWASVLGHSVPVSRIQDLSSLDPDQLVDALEQLEARALLRSDASGGRYDFAHDVVREAVYTELSPPRRRLMHLRVAQKLHAGHTTPAIATEVAHHASLAGDALLGVRACIVAGLRSLRAFANGEAEALAKRGLSLVDMFEGPERAASTLELLHVLYTARTPEPEAAARKIRVLTDEALDAGMTTAARLGFQMLSYLRWERGSMIAAHDNIMRAERISRSGSPAERTTALSQAAKCLVLLERDLALAESFLLEANALSGRIGDSPSAMHFALGMMHEHRGELDEAAAAYREARMLGREQGDPLAEYCALEHLSMLALDRGERERCRELATGLAELGGRVRAGAEQAAGRALHALARRSCGDRDAQAELDEAIESLRRADSKYRLAYVLSRLAKQELSCGAPEVARERAEDALAVATAIGRASEMVLAHTLLARCALKTDDQERLAHHVEALRELASRELSCAARTQLTQTLEASAGSA